ncbi:DUF4249 domain-containing protein [Fulvivirga ligni]|uniref:DUF4249 domain-containing protein n=1 Tax=Fulvivirga ligni TaxID=2904246 RepID=UPI001F35FCA1|nr:DUF4249 domain-containing protein [Fulvivirga ligni]UII20166.1 DUF4249 domain-containing protein [Fulvivirga ligni]
MRKHILLYTILATITVLFSCDDPIDLDTKQAEPVMVIEGLVTNEEHTQYVRVTKSVSFYSDQSNQPITNATVVVSDDQGNVYNYSYSDNGGYYISDVAYAGEIGRVYSLVVNAEGEEYTASDKLVRVTTIDSLTVEIDEEEYEDPEDEGNYYEVLLYTKEPQDTEDYYLFKFYRNGDLMRDEVTDIYYSDDEFLAENIDGITTPGYFSLGDTATVEMYSISLNGFKYYSDLTNLLNSDGGLFGPPPVNPLGNISNGAMGFFQVSAVDRSSILIKE